MELLKIRDEIVYPLGIEKLEFAASLVKRKNSDEAANLSDDIAGLHKPYGFDKVLHSAVIVCF